MKRVYGWTNVRYVITKFSRMDSLPNFLTHGALLRARSSAKTGLDRATRITQIDLLIICNVLVCWYSLIDSMILFDGIMIMTS